MKFALFMVILSVVFSFLFLNSFIREAHIVDLVSCFLWIASTIIWTQNVRKVIRRKRMLKIQSKLVDICKTEI